MEKNLRHIEGGRAGDKELAEKREQQGRESSWRGEGARQKEQPGRELVEREPWIGRGRAIW
jgi:hypothetical protein